jgi:Pathogenicity locus
MSVFDKTAPAWSLETRAMTNPLTTIPNVGPAVARQLERLNIAAPDDLRGRDPYELFDRLCELDGRSHDPCLLDTFVAAVSYADGGPARPWWEFSRERNARQRG